MVRLLGEVAAAPGDHLVKNRQLMNGLSRLTAADFWAWGFCAALEPGQQPVYLMQLHGGFASAERFGRWMRAIDHPDMARLTEPFAVEMARGRPATRTLEQVDPEGRFEQMEVSRCFREAGIRGIMISLRPHGPQSYTGIGLYRRTGLPVFSAREARIAHIVMSEVPWLHQQGVPGVPAMAIPRLAPRARTVLNLLLRGMSRKEIAASLRISPHTANDHVKAVFQHYGVHTQEGLLNRFFVGDGGDIDSSP
jgi:DNA-binding CsgD family transcriptional regulator